MSLCLTITSYHKITPGQCPEKTLEKGVMAIGRSSENDWVLPDPERLVSSRHCVIQYKDGRYYLTDNSTNGVELVNAGIRLRRGNSEPLQDGEVIRIGEYEIRVRIDFNLQWADSPLSGVDTSNSFEALMGRAAAPTPPPVNLPAAHFQGGSAMDTLPDLFDFLAPASVPPAAVPDHVPAQQHDFRPPTPVIAPAPVMEPTYSANSHGCGRCSQRERDPGRLGPVRRYTESPRQPACADPGGDSRDRCAGTFGDGTCPSSSSSRRA